MSDESLALEHLGDQMRALRRVLAEVPKAIATVELARLSTWRAPTVDDVAMHVLAGLATGTAHPSSTGWSAMEMAQAAYELAQAYIKVRDREVRDAAAGAVSSSPGSDGRDTSVPPEPGPGLGPADVDLGGEA